MHIFHPMFQPRTLLASREVYFQGQISCRIRCAILDVFIFIFLKSLLESDTSQALHDLANFDDKLPQGLMQIFFTFGKLSA